MPVKKIKKNFFLDGWVYALGGYNGRNRMCSVERYDPGRNQWEMVTPMNKQRSDASAASLKNKVLYVILFNTHYESILWLLFIVDSRLNK